MLMFGLNQRANSYKTILLNMRANRAFLASQGHRVPEHALAVQAADAVAAAELELEKLIQFITNNE